MILCEQRCYLVFTDDDSDALQTGSVHAVDIFALADAADVSAVHVGKSRSMAPVPGGESTYALLHDALCRSGAIALACVVVQCRPQLALLAPSGDVLVLKILERAGATSPLRHVDLEAEDLPLTEREMALARTIIDLMAASASGGKCGFEAGQRHDAGTALSLCAPAADEGTWGSASAPGFPSGLSLLPSLYDGLCGTEDTLGILLPGGDPQHMARRGSCTRSGAAPCRASASRG